jgi:hypothetical protein
MSVKTDQADAQALAAIGFHPGIKGTNGRGQRNPRLNSAAVRRLIDSGLVVPPSSNGRLYLTEAGTEAYWRPDPREADPTEPASIDPFACGVRDCDCHLYAGRP